MRGFIVGSLLLIGLSVAVQPRGVAAAEEGGSWVISGLRRLLSPDVAGVPQLRRVGGTETRRIPIPNVPRRG